MSFTIDLPVRWGDIDSFGVINNACYLTYFEQVRFEYFAALGILENGQFPFVVAETTVRFVKPGRMGGSVRIEARVTRLGRTSFAMDYEGSQDGVVLVTAQAVMVYVDGALRPRPIPPQAREAIAAQDGL